MYIISASYKKPIKSLSHCHVSITYPPINKGSKVIAMIVMKKSSYQFDLKTYRIMVHSNLTSSDFLHFIFEYCIDWAKWIKDIVKLLELRLNIALSSIPNESKKLELLFIFWFIPSYFNLHYNEMTHTIHYNDKE